MKSQPEVKNRRMRRSESRISVCPPPRFCAQAASQRVKDRLRVMRPTNARRQPGRAGGMAFQVCSHVSLTHSSVSSWLRRMLKAMEG